MSDESTASQDSVFCWKCGAKISKDAEFCPKCGEKQKRESSNSDAVKNNDPNASPKSRLVASLLCLFLGIFGAHRFYVGKTGSAIAMILVTVLTIFTAGSIWALVDLIMICCGTFKDAEGKLITNWQID
jgi:Predicted membrane protein